MEAVVEYNYVAQEPDELTLKKGDIITEIKVMLGGWWEGTLRDKRGMFPDNFVKVLDTSTGGVTPSTGSEGSGSTKTDEMSLRNGSSGRQWCKVLFSYEPCNEDELTLVPQDSIQFLGEVEEGWWRGRLRGRVGVFPSNFVSPPVPEEPEKHKERDKKELCRVLYPYEAANEDELTLVEGQIITLISRDAPDKGWWKGELKGQIGLFPDNFVEMISVKTEPQDQEPWHEMSTKSIPKHSHQAKKSEKAHVRKSLDVRNVHTDTGKKVASPSSSITSTSPSAAGTGTDKKNLGGHSIMSSLKRLVGDAGSNNGNGSTNIVLGEELDGVERGEGAPLSHLTASRAKAPRRRPPTSQHLRCHATGPMITSSTTANLASVPSTILEDNLSNGAVETTIDQLREVESEGLIAKARRKAPWVEELKMNQLERKKIVCADRVDKPEIKKERPYARLMTSTNPVDLTTKPESENDDKQKDDDKAQRTDGVPVGDHPSPVTWGSLPYVPYFLYTQLAEKVAALEENVAILQQTVKQLSEQRAIRLVNTSLDSKD
ncbi:hypothetical protein KM043_011047 [Ampulex compressa]|nr:hypothetical protein KM043_011047 [Ampulex compressa]